MPLRRVRNRVNQVQNMFRQGTSPCQSDRVYNAASVFNPQPAIRTPQSTMADEHSTSDSPVKHSTGEIAQAPGSTMIPPWRVAELPEAPRFSWKNWIGMIGPGFYMGAMALGGGEWLMGPLITAKYGGGLLWLALFSILGQLIYNIEVSRYTLYTGEPIFTGKFRTLPGPIFWIWIYLALDMGMFFPYLASSAAMPLLALINGELPDPVKDEQLLRWTAIGIFSMAFVPLFVGGKIYNALKAIMAVKIIVVIGFLLFIAVFYSSIETWVEIFSGMFKVGNYPTPDGTLDNFFVALWEGRLPVLELAILPKLCALVAIAGGGGLGQTAVSNYTREQGWGMGAHIGSIPSIIGGRNIELSHEGAVFKVTDDVLPRWRRWYNHVRREQIFMWFPACIFGLALPSMLSVQFLPRGYEVENQWMTSVMTANALEGHVGGDVGKFYWYMTMLCGFLVLGMATPGVADICVRRWSDVLWSSNLFKNLDPKNIRYFYFGMLCIYMLFGMTMLSVGKPTTLLVVASLLFNFGLGFSCWHSLAVNLIMLPRELRPNWFVRCAMFLAGLFFLTVGAIATWTTLLQQGWI